MLPLTFRMLDMPLATFWRSVPRSRGCRAPIPPGKRRSFHRPRWTGVTRTRRPADSLKVKPQSGSEGGRGSRALPDLPATCDATAPTGSPVPSTDPAALQVRHMGMHDGEGVPAPAALEQSQPRSPPGCVHNILPSPGSTRRPPRRTNRHQRQRSLGQSWDRPEDARQARRAVEVRRERRGAVLLRTPTQPVFRDCAGLICPSAVSGTFRIAPAFRS